VRTAGYTLRSYLLLAVVLIAIGVTGAAYHASAHESGPYLCDSKVMQPGDVCEETNTATTPEQTTNVTYADMVAQRNRDNTDHSIPALSIGGRIVMILGLLVAGYGVVVYLRRRRA
jgi:hypothetical protein